jgi:hypothetical protein
LHILSMAKAMLSASNTSSSISRSVPTAYGCCKAGVKRGGRIAIPFAIA